MIESIEIITKTDLATYGPVGLVLIISLIVAYELIRVRKTLTSVVNSTFFVLSILLTELRARNIIPL
jgi:hypothetical protein